MCYLTNSILIRSQRRGVERLPILHILRSVKVERSSHMSMCLPCFAHMSMGRAEWTRTAQPEPRVVGTSKWARAQFVLCGHGRLGHTWSREQSASLLSDSQYISSTCRAQTGFFSSLRIRSHTVAQCSWVPEPAPPTDSVSDHMLMWLKRSYEYRP